MPNFAVLGLCYNAAIFGSLAMLSMRSFVRLIPLKLALKLGTDVPKPSRMLIVAQVAKLGLSIAIASASRLCLIEQFWTVMKTGFVSGFRLMRH